MRSGAIFDEKEINLTGDFCLRAVAPFDIDNEVRGVKAMPGGIVVPPDGVVKTRLM